SRSHSRSWSEGSIRKPPGGGPFLPVPDPDRGDVPALLPPRDRPGHCHPHRSLGAASIRRRSCCACPFDFLGHRDRSMSAGSCQVLVRPILTLCLASASPRRRALLGELGLRFEVDPVEVDEHVLPGETPGAYVRRLAADKARAGCRAPCCGIAVGADTAVV